MLEWKHEEVFSVEVVSLPVETMTFKGDFEKSSILQKLE